MGDYAASIRVSTKIETDKARSQLMSLENRLIKAADKVEDINHKMKELEVKKAPTQEYQNLSDQLGQAEKELTKMISRQNELESIGIKNGAAWDSINEEVAAASIKVDSIKEKMFQMEEAGKGFTLGNDTAEYTKLTQQLKYAKNDMDTLEQKYHETINKMDADNDKFGRKSASTWSKISSAAKKGLSGVGGILKSVQNGIQKMGNIAKRVFKRFNNDTKKSNGLLSIMKSRLGGIALSLLVFNWITRGFNALMAGMKEGLQNLARYSKDYNAVMSDMVSALATLKNSFATAFAPIASIVIPFLTQLINALTAAVNKVAQFIAALTGKTTWTRAKKQNIDYAESLDKVSKTAKEAYRSLADFDELTVLSKNESSDSEADTGAVSPDDMFEEVAIDSKIKEFADKIKKILAKLFAPLKEAWKREGKFVMDSWKFALDEVGKLLKDIGRDFLEVWNQEATIKIFQDILHIVGDIGLVVGNLAANFRKAWNENKVGKKILENIRDLFGIIVANIRDAADFTVEWSKNINFSPLLNAFEQFTDSLKPVVDFLSGILTDFYKQVLLPLGQWVIEKGLPDLLDVFTAFNERVDWAVLRQRLSDFWDHVEPFAETVGEGLILFIEKCAIALGDFLNSPAFESFLTSVEEWMDNVKPEDVANTFKKIVEGIIGLKLALFGFSVISGITGVVKTLKEFFGFFSGGKAVAKGMETATKSVGKFSSGLAGYVAPVVAGVATFEAFAPKFVDYLATLDDGVEKAEIIKEKYLGLTKLPALLVDGTSAIFQKITGVFTKMPTYIEGLTPSWQVLEEAIKHVGDGVIYSDEQLKKMQDTMGLSADDIETIRQEMLDYNDEMRELADAYPELWDASAQTIANFSEGMHLMYSGTFKTKEELIEFAQEAGYTGDIIDLLCDNFRTCAQSINGFENDTSSSTTTMQTSFDTLGINVANNVNGILGSLQSFIDKTFELKNSIKDLLASGFERIGSIGTLLSGAAASARSSMGYSYSAAGYRMPALATGGITTGTTIAKIGEAGREAVLPLERNTGWMDTLANKINGSGEMSITVNLDGREIYRNVVERSQIARASGRPAFDF